MPHSESLKMLNMMAFIRKTNGIKFPGEDGLDAREYETSSAHAEESYETISSQPEEVSSDNDQVDT